MRTRKNKRSNYAKKALSMKCRLKSCKARKYKSIYGMSQSGGIREPAKPSF